MSDKAPGKFSGLRQLGEKIFKFKQVSCYNNEMTNVFHTQSYTNVRQASEGFCFPLACTFLKDWVRGQAHTPFRRNHGVKAGSTELDMLIAEDSAKRHNLFSQGVSDGDRYCTSVAASYGIDITVPNSSTASGDFYPGQIPCFTENGNYIINMTGKHAQNQDWNNRKTVNHAISISVSTGKIVLFDGNIGAYRIPPNNIVAFLSEYSISYINQGYEWHTFRIFKVTHISPEFH